jgi:hypothetical protein
MGWDEPGVEAVWMGVRQGAESSHLEYSEHIRLTPIPQNPADRVRGSGTAVASA